MGKVLVVRQIELVPDDLEYVYDVDERFNAAVNQDGTRLTLYMVVGEDDGLSVDELINKAVEEMQQDHDNDAPAAEEQDD